jgi:hypothetical protein
MSDNAMTHAVNNFMPALDEIFGKQVVSAAFPSKASTDTQNGYLPLLAECFHLLQLT